MPSLSPPPDPWTLERSERVVEDRWITVRADRCRTAEGVLVDPYYVLEYPDWVQIVAMDDEDRILLVEQYRHGLGVVSLELPCGAIEPGDDDPLAAARRELAEETGFEADRLELVATLAPNPANQNNLCHVILARDLSEGRGRSDDPTERVLVHRREIEEVRRLAMSGGIVQAMHVAAIAMVFAYLERRSAP